jgi:N-acetylglucosaminyl-diphospho-decaprenol L-rhamnosyltransferase
MDLSIIIVSFNTKDVLKKCLESLPSLAEIIVIDNGSKDGSPEMIKEFRKSKQPKIKLVENKENLGFARAVNQGIRLSQGNFVLLLNSDIIVKARAIEKMKSFAQKSPQAGVIGGRLLNPDGSIQGSCFRLPTLIRIIKEFYFNGEPVLSKYAPVGERPLEVEAVQGAVFLIPRKVLRKVGFLDERYFMYFEDLAYCRQVRKAGFKVYYLPEAEFIHFHGQSGRQIPERTYNWLVESSKIYHGKLNYYLITFIIWSGRKWRKILKF